MAPTHAKRKFWWELLFISVLIFLLAGVRPQREREAIAAAQAILAPAVVLSAVVVPLPTPLAMQ